MAPNPERSRKLLARQDARGTMNLIRDSEKVLRNEREARTGSDAQPPEIRPTNDMDTAQLAQYAVQLIEAEEPKALVSAERFMKMKPATQSRKLRSRTLSRHKFFIQTFNDGVDLEEINYEKLQQGTPFPPLDVLKSFFRYWALVGNGRRSDFVKLETLKQGAGQLITAIERHTGVTPTPQRQSQIKDLKLYIATDLQKELRLPDQLEHPNSSGSAMV